MAVPLQLLYKGEGKEDFLWHHVSGLKTKGASNPIFTVLV